MRSVGSISPTWRRLASETSRTSRAARRSPGAPAVAGRLLERSKGKDTTTGHWELMGIVTPEPMPTYPHGFPFEVIEEFAHKTGRGVIGNKAASGTEIIQELGEEHQKTGKWIVYTSADSVFQIAAHEETIPLDELYAPAQVARGILTGPHAVGRVIARPFTGEPGNYQRTPNRHDFSLLPPQPNYLTQIRAAGAKVHGVGKIRDIFAGQDIDEFQTTKSNVEGINGDRGAPEDARLGAHLHEPRGDGHALGPPQRPGQLRAAASRTSTAGCPTCSRRCARAISSSSPPTTAATRPRRRPTTRASTRCSSATSPGRNAGGRNHDGEFADVGATVNAWLGGKPSSKLPGQPFVEP